MLVSELARVEVPAALWKKHRTGEINAGDARLLAAQLEADFRGTRSRPPRWTT
jgi:hypothetical protein